MKKNQEQKLPVKSKDLLTKTLQSLIEGLGGLAASDKKQLFLSLSHILQRVKAFGFLKAIEQEWEELRKKGRIKEDYVDSDQHLTCLHELLNALDAEIVDETRFNILKKIFLVAATETRSTRDDILPQQLLKLTRSLSSGEVLVLEATYRLSKKVPVQDQDVTAAEWLETVAAESGLKFSHLVELHEEKLMNKYLLTKRRWADHSGIFPSGNYRLTGLALELCEFIAFYDELKAR